jgi:predicted RNA-binding Zn-ribbon protein involved in translation (DUF1610 family)
MAESSTEKTLRETVRADAKKWRDRAAAEGAHDPKADQTLALLDEIDRLRAAMAAAGWIVCPRCEEQTRDVGACGICRNIGWLDENAGALSVSQATDTQERDGWLCSTCGKAVEEASLVWPYACPHCNTTPPAGQSGYFIRASLPVASEESP